MTISQRITVTTTAALMLWTLAQPVNGATAKALYESALAREQAMRAAARRGEDPSLKEVRALIAHYEALVKRYPASGYADNALYQAAMLAADAYRRLVDEHDRRLAVSLLKRLVNGYPASSLVAIARTQLHDFEPMRTAGPATTAATDRPLASAPPPSLPSARAPVRATAAPDVKNAEIPIGTSRVADPESNVKPADRAPSNGTPPVVAIKAIKRSTLPEVVRVQIELEAEVAFHEERLDNPARMFVDLRNTRSAPPLADAVLNYSDDAVRRIRIGRHPQNTTRVVVDLTDVSRYSVFTLSNPYRIVIDCERRAGIVPRPTLGADAQPMPAGPVDAPVDTTSPPSTDTSKGDKRPSSAAIPSAVSASKAPAPAPPAANLQGGFSLSRQLGLGVSRVVIDPGHGGHDPGAQGPNGLVESTLVLDVALRLEKLLLKDTGIEVVMTRHADEFVPLEERTALANREAADLFLSIHANASPNNRARGVETYFLNFASNPEAAAVAARENMLSGRTMNNLPDMVRAIALNNKVDESRDFASMVQQSLVQRLRAPNKTVRDLGVKQAPFVVLIGAAMPSVLAEISFVTNRQEATLLKGGAYRQRIAEALFAAVVRYQRSLKTTRTIAKREAQEKER